MPEANLKARTDEFAKFDLYPVHYELEHFLDDVYLSICNELGYPIVFISEWDAQEIGKLLKWHDKKRIWVTCYNHGQFMSRWEVDSGKPRNG